MFSNQPAPPDIEAGHDFQKMEEKNDANRRRVARELVAACDVDQIFAMASAVENPVQLGIALIDVDINPTLCELVIERACRSSEAKLSEFGRGMIHAGVRALGTKWATLVVRKAVAAGWPPPAIVVVLLGMPLSSQTWTLAREAGPDVERRYWEAVPWLFIIHSEPADLVTAAEALLLVGRSVDAVASSVKPGPPNSTPSSSCRR